MKPVLVLLILCAGVVAQSSDDLKKKYGEPVSETFLLRSGITVTASNNAAGQITEMVIAPLVTDLIKSKGHGLTRDVLKDLIDELVPVSHAVLHKLAAF